ncbi:MAG TPA: isocitrate lyase/phosphoenolpyruvate mutase family protein, partial [Burkholderiales bacterium]|nr:isocitrate lyase/phosphoenolpyruvate mutase family protein [Burkholderiales bacterium]
RCDARGVAGGSVDDLVHRANAYLDAGADMIFPEALTNEAEVARCAREITGPLHYNRTGVSPRLTLQQLNDFGIAIVSNATGALRSSMIAMWDYMNAFAQDDVAFVKEFTERHKQHPAGDLHAFVGFAEIKKLEHEFLAADEVTKKYAGAVGFQP